MSYEKILCRLHLRKHNWSTYYVNRTAFVIGPTSTPIHDHSCSINPLLDHLLEYVTRIDQHVRAHPDGNHPDMIWAVQYDMGNRIYYTTRYEQLNKFKRL